ncbi:uncharacterized protein CMU_029390 [Cryptosporidium muris RN66]|uniref:Uncharacterized protein n=1 Tax=Cryptosporidium muris (strain RN66) TaxID=441375 RepID=B6AI24_CRYMR|nr:uncharacterized protein CMU_029390 [Cryptosporidium muris RN66]EEA07865.1 hypothetical protein CMU_029390 [Cryptosporidium muris RN66]|eukprot:XP_002142214.1 hypothetical protein [Cryptosporidium muris RN66]
MSNQNSQNIKTIKQILILLNYINITGSNIQIIYQIPLNLGYESTKYEIPIVLYLSIGSIKFLSLLDSHKLIIYSSRLSLEYSRIIGFDNAMRAFNSEEVNIKDPFLMALFYKINNDLRSIFSIENSIELAIQESFENMEIDKFNELNTIDIVVSKFILLKYNIDLTFSNEVILSSEFRKLITLFTRDLDIFKSENLNGKDITFRYLIGIIIDISINIEKVVINTTDEYFSTIILSLENLKLNSTIKKCSVCSFSFSVNDILLNTPIYSYVKEFNNFECSFIKYTCNLFHIELSHVDSSFFMELNSGDLIYNSSNTQNINYVMNIPKIEGKLLFNENIKNNIIAEFLDGSNLLSKIYIDINISSPIIYMKSIYRNEENCIQDCLNQSHMGQQTLTKFMSSLSLLIIVNLPFLDIISSEINISVQDCKTCLKIMDGELRLNHDVQNVLIDSIKSACYTRHTYGDLKLLIDDSIVSVMSGNFKVRLLFEQIFYQYDKAYILQSIKKGTAAILDIQLYRWIYIDFLSIKLGLFEFEVFFSILLSNIPRKYNKQDNILDSIHRGSIISRFTNILRNKVVVTSDQITIKLSDNSFNGRNNFQPELECFSEELKILGNSQYILSYKLLRISLQMSEYSNNKLFRYKLKINNLKFLHYTLDKQRVMTIFKAGIIHIVVDNEPKVDPKLFYKVIEDYSYKFLPSDSTNHISILISLLEDDSNNNRNDDIYPQNNSLEYIEFNISEKVIHDIFLISFITELPQLIYNNENKSINSLPLYPGILQITSGKIHVNFYGRDYIEDPIIFLQVNGISFSNNRLNSLGELSIYLPNISIYKDICSIKSILSILNFGQDFSCGVFVKWMQNCINNKLETIVCMELSSFYFLLSPYIVECIIHAISIIISYTRIFPYNGINSEVFLNTFYNRKVKYIFNLENFKKLSNLTILSFSINVLSYCIYLINDDSFIDFRYLATALLTGKYHIFLEFQFNERKKVTFKLEILNQKLNFLVGYLQNNIQLNITNLDIVTFVLPLVHKLKYFEIKNTYKDFKEDNVCYELVYRKSYIVEYSKLIEQTKIAYFHDLSIHSVSRWEHGFNVTIFCDLHINSPTDGISVKQKLDFTNIDIVFVPHASTIDPELCLPFYMILNSRDWTLIKSVLSGFSNSKTSCRITKSIYRMDTSYFTVIHTIQRLSLRLPSFYLGYCIEDFLISTEALILRFKELIINSNNTGSGNIFNTSLTIGISKFDILGVTYSAVKKDTMQKLEIFNNGINYVLDIPNKTCHNYSILGPAEISLNLSINTVPKYLNASLISIFVPFSIFTTYNYNSKICLILKINLGNIVFTDRLFEFFNKISVNNSQEFNSIEVEYYYNILRLDAGNIKSTEINDLRQCPYYLSIMESTLDLLIRDANSKKCQNVIIPIVCIFYDNKTGDPLNLELPVNNFKIKIYPKSIYLVGIKDIFLISRFSLNYKETRNSNSSLTALSTEKYLIEKYQYNTFNAMFGNYKFLSITIQNQTILNKSKALYKDSIQASFNYQYQYFPCILIKSLVEINSDLSFDIEIVFISEINDDFFKYDLKSNKVLELPISVASSCPYMIIKSKLHPNIKVTKPNEDTIFNYPLFSKIWSCSCNLRILYQEAVRSKNLHSFTTSSSCISDFGGIFFGIECYIDSKQVIKYRIFSPIQITNSLIFPIEFRLSDYKGNHSLRNTNENQCTYTKKLKPFITDQVTMFDSAKSLMLQVRAILYSDACDSWSSSKAIVINSRAGNILEYNLEYIHGINVSNISIIVSNERNHVNIFIWCSLTIVNHTEHRLKFLSKSFDECHSTDKQPRDNNFGICNSVILDPSSNSKSALSSENWESINSNWESFLPENELSSFCGVLESNQYSLYLLSNEYSKQEIEQDKDIILQDNEEVSYLIPLYLDDQVQDMDYYSSDLSLTKLSSSWLIIEFSKISKVVAVTLSGFYPSYKSRNLPEEVSERLSTCKILIFRPSWVLLNLCSYPLNMMWSLSRQVYSLKNDLDLENSILYHIPLFCEFDTFPKIVQGGIDLNDIGKLSKRSICGKMCFYSSLSGYSYGYINFQRVDMKFSSHSDGVFSSSWTNPFALNFSNTKESSKQYICNLYYSKYPLSSYQQIYSNWSVIRVNILHKFGTFIITITPINNDIDNLYKDFPLKRITCCYNSSIKGVNQVPFVIENRLPFNLYFQQQLPYTSDSEISSLITGDSQNSLIISETIDKLQKPRFTNSCIKDFGNSTLKFKDDLDSQLECFSKEISLISKIKENSSNNLPLDLYWLNTSNYRSIREQNINSKTISQNTTELGIDSRKSFNHSEKYILESSTNIQSSTRPIILIPSNSGPYIWAKDTEIPLSNEVKILILQDIYNQTNEPKLQSYFWTNSSHISFYEKPCSLRVIASISLNPNNLSIKNNLSLLVLPIFCKGRDILHPYWCIARFRVSEIKVKSAYKTFSGIFNVYRYPTIFISLDEFVTIDSISYSIFVWPNSNTTLQSRNIRDYESTLETVSEHHISCFNMRISLDSTNITFGDIFSVCKIPNYSTPYKSSLPVINIFLGPVKFQLSTPIQIKRKKYNKYILKPFLKSKYLTLYPHLHSKSLNKRILRIHITAEYIEVHLLNRLSEDMKFVQIGMLSTRLSDQNTSLNCPRYCRKLGFLSSSLLQNSTISYKSSKCSSEFSTSSHHSSLQQVTLKLVKQWNNQLKNSGLSDLATSYFSNWTKLSSSSNCFHILLDLELSNNYTQEYQYNTRICSKSLFQIIIHRLMIIIPSISVILDTNHIEKNLDEISRHLNFRARKYKIKNLEDTMAQTSNISRFIFNEITNFNMSTKSEFNLWFDTLYIGIGETKVTVKSLMRVLSMNNARLKWKSLELHSLLLAPREAWNHTQNYFIHQLLLQSYQIIFALDIPVVKPFERIRNFGSNLIKGLKQFKNIFIHGDLTNSSLLWICTPISAIISTIKNIIYSANKFSDIERAELPLEKPKINDLWEEELEFQ